MSIPSSCPAREIRASYDESTITLYQAYNKDIAASAVAEQRLDASPLFRKGRMTWVKPSWCWMMYRSGYSYKDQNQERILAISMKHEHFIFLLERATLASGHHRGSDTTGSRNSPQPPPEQGQETTTYVAKVQWDPERTPRLERLPYRSIQIGIAGTATATWINDWICGIEDVTDRAKRLKETLESYPGISHHDLVEMGVMPAERGYDVPEGVRERLQMT